MAITSIQNALSGLRYNRLRVDVAATNLANAQSRDFIPKDVAARALGGSVVSTVQNRTPATIRTLDENGTEINLPNLSPDKELIQVNLAETGYRANGQVLRVSNSLQQRLLDVLA